ncbi:Toll/interleukin-1 receptor homology (TIR) domain superfamily, partial [Arabidopsis thaliana x Arabidopsis arenosa]
MASSSSSRTWTYRVFASFHGPDVRKSFLSHFRKQFISNGITMFDDQKIVRSQTIAPSLTQGIRESKISIVILSKNYASSTWCLDELLEILRCREDIGQIVMTVFYGVDPSDVRKQTGEFGTVFNKTCARRTKEERRNWSQALNDVGNIAGEHFLNWENEAEMIEKIARDVSEKLNATPSSDFDSMVGIETHLKEMELLLDFDYDGVKVVGIFGPAGIGKTTIARALHSLLFNKFQLTCFVENLSGSYPIGLDEYGLKLRLQEHLLSKILKLDGMRISHLGAVKERLCDMKVLIVLDDVNDVKQLEALANDTTWFGPGSRVIVTTENKELLQRHGIDNTYHVGFPSDEKAIEILCRYAFKQSSPRRGFKYLAKNVTWLCGNLPLGLRVVGSSLHGKNEDEWVSVIRRLETIIDRDIEEVLRVGYESLHENEQSLFLHIAVFFNNKDVDLVKAMLADDNLDIAHGLKIMVNKSLIYVSNNREIRMHKLLQQVGKQAINRQEPWKRLILTNAQEICHVLENDKGTGVVSGISFDTSGISEVILSNRALRRMCNLRFLSVYKTRHDGNDIMHIPDDMKFPPRLRLLHWEAYPSKSLPLGFCLENLVELNMKDSQLEKLWEGTQLLRNLKKMDLSRSVHLKELPDLSNATNLERLELGDCMALVELPTSIGNLHKLENLVMRNCISLEVIPTHINLASLEHITMTGCSRLKTFPDFSTNIERLLLRGTSVEEVPASIRHWSRLSDFCINDNGNLKRLTYFPERVELLTLSYTDIETIPNCIKGFNGLKSLDVSGCRKLTSLPELPMSLGLLVALDCESLEIITYPLNTPSARLNFTNCFQLDEESRRLIIQRCATQFLDGFACLPGRVMPNEFNHRTTGNSLTIRLSSTSFKFKACVVISPNQQHHPSEHTDIRCIVGSYNKVICVEHPSESTRIRTEHLCIFHGSVSEVSSSETLFEFCIDASNPFDNFKILECGVRILTNEPARSSKTVSRGLKSHTKIFKACLRKRKQKKMIGYLLKDSRKFGLPRDNRIIQLHDSEDNNNDIDHVVGVEEKKKPIDCWSWLFICFDLSNIVRNIGKLVLGIETTESIDR